MLDPWDGRSLEHAHPRTSGVFRVSGRKVQRGKHAWTPETQPRIGTVGQPFKVPGRLLN